MPNKFCIINTVNKPFDFEIASYKLNYINLNQNQKERLFKQLENWTFCVKPKSYSLDDDGEINKDYPIEMCKLNSHNLIEFLSTHKCHLYFLVDNDLSFNGLIVSFNNEHLDPFGNSSFNHKCILFKNGETVGENVETFSSSGMLGNLYENIYTFSLIKQY